MIEEATILQEGLIVRMGQETDLGIGENDPAQQIVLKAPFDGAPQRLLDQTAPRLAMQWIQREAAAQFVFGRKRA
jgi:hypothetical protein